MAGFKFHLELFPSSTSQRRQDSVDEIGRLSLVLFISSLARPYFLFCFAIKIFNALNNLTFRPSWWKNAQAQRLSGIVYGTAEHDAYIMPHLPLQLHGYATLSSHVRCGICATDKRSAQLIVSQPLIPLFEPQTWWICTGFLSEPILTTRDSSGDKLKPQCAHRVLFLETSLSTSWH